MSGPGPRLSGASGEGGMVESSSPWKSMMLMGVSGMGLNPRRGALHTGDVVFIQTLHQV